jgi:uncharacterized DUF497 family protein
VEITYDPAKNEKNVRERGLSFDRAREFEFTSAQIESEYRHGEWRRLAKGFLDGRLHMLVYKPEDGGIRVISFRKANKREVKSYEEGRRNLEQRAGVD